MSEALVQIVSQVPQLGVVQGGPDLEQIDADGVEALDDVRRAPVVDDVQLDRPEAGTGAFVLEVDADVSTLAAVVVPRSEPVLA
ncbi:hypothetical protein ABZ819_09155 [Streptomyces venezuelae]|uniref:hypothetical protein n=1 Tax=Streptomyces venezuelae TaxID=54571 RepID=UPI00343B7F4F